ncbi:aldo/keto reductase [Spartinivicinus poritis]|uniref:Aldo/keto reductase n=1 Tax=Spartinivicinus poritis TaxID=2994640 RepID=A0ABT5UBL8_9GAMM|nr:aldo/keto reductase [Spartinivicinus sp. A2-2]MDE1463776.1 aldo/keto reductase [Spartinivicinus sp. A2-2]
MKTEMLDAGSSIPLIGLGTWLAAPGEVYTATKTAIEMGYRHIDCAPVYSNESEIGDALTDSIKKGLVTREEIWITSKLWNNSHAPEHVIPAIKQTLKDLKLDYIDLFLIHWPIVQRKEVIIPKTAEDFIPLDHLPISETWQQLERVVELGLCRNIGVSNFSIKKLKELINSAQVKPFANQVELHPYLQQNNLLTFCKRNDVHLTAYSPLGSFGRPGIIKQPNEPILLKDPVIVSIANRMNISVAQVVLAWALQRGTSVIPKSINPLRMQENLSVNEVLLDKEAILQISSLDKHYRYSSGSFWAIEGSPYTMKNIWDE